jgi:hypothetical protein
MGGDDVIDVSGKKSAGKESNIPAPVEGIAKSPGPSSRGSVFVGAKTEKREFRSASGILSMFSSSVVGEMAFVMGVVSRFSSCELGDFFAAIKCIPGLLAPPFPAFPRLGDIFCGIG